ncbi:PD-(D/E)XK motif protein [Bifidobacterium moukalabense]|uniref:PD-(D/E)XK motif protein n=1 Tax=Bifidobacterium moukalabense DSM 27321 TaxID=1435051 RepID=W4NBC9_9BIFI|nr:PD-(D/E)XK motif protein [Bifidobacterium moukalabense]ETY71791.1 hypothetical protein BMOU_0529 [Bifidobacterium moukalabense DSM 27321]
MRYRIDEIISFWREGLRYPGQTNRELDTSLQLPVVLGCTAEGLPYAMLLTDSRPKVPKRMEAIDVRVGKRSGAGPSEAWSLTFILQDQSLVHAFAEICLAFAERIAEASSKDAALRQIYVTVDQWQRLLKSGRDADVVRILRGAFGELASIFEISERTGKSIEDICASWTGPYERPQDFIFPDDGSAWEVKTVRPAAECIRISSPEQLDTSRYSISLIVVEMKENADGLTLPALVDALRGQSSDPSTVTGYIDDGLSKLGLSIYSGLVSQTTFEISRISVYAVRSDFPRMEAKDVPENVLDLTYSLNRGRIRPFMLHTGVFQIKDSE